MSFGFSISDFLALIDLLQEAHKALDGSTEAEYKSLCESLTSLNRSVRATATFFLTTLPNGINPDPTAMDGIRFELDCFKKILSEFLTKHEKYTKSFLCTKGWRLKDQLRKIEWGQYHKNLARDLQTKLLVHMSSLQSYTAGEISQCASRIEQQVSEGMGELQKTQEKLQEVENMVDKGLKKIDERLNGFAFAIHHEILELAKANEANAYVYSVRCGA